MGQIMRDADEPGELNFSGSRILEFPLFRIPRRVRGNLAVAILITFLLGGLGSIALSQGGPEKEMRPLTFFGSEHEIWSNRVTIPVEMVLHETRDLLVVVGNTYEYDLPVTENALCGQYQGSRDGYIAVMNKSCTELFYCSYIGGESDDNVSFMQFLDNDRVVIGGGTFSEMFPLPESVHSQRSHGGRDGWMAVFNTLTESFECVRILGGPRDDTFTDADITESNDVVVVGLSKGGMTTTKNAFQRFCRQGTEGQEHDGICIMMRDTTTLYATYFGGSGGDLLDQVVVLGNGRLALLGTTTSTALYVSNDAYMSEYQGGQQDSFLAIIDTASRALIYGTYIGGNGVDAYPRARISGNKLHIWSSTTSSDLKTTDYAITQKPVHEVSGGPPYMDSYMMIFDVLTHEVSYMTYISGDGYDAVNEVVPLADGRVLLALSTASSEVMGIDRTGVDDRGRNYLFELDYKNNTASFVCNTAYNGWTTLKGFEILAGNLYGYGYLSISKQTYPISGAVKETISGADDVLIAVLENAVPAACEEVEEAASEFQIFPNPMTSTAHVKFTLDDYDHTVLVVSDVLGRVMLRRTLPAGSGFVEIDTRTGMYRQMSKGVYHVSLVSGTHVQTKILVVQ